MSRGRLRVAAWENVRFALSSMRGQKLRSFLTLLGITAGVATVIMMVSFVAGFNAQITTSFTAFGTYLVQFQKYEPRFHGGEIPEEQRRRRDLTLEDAWALKRLSKRVKAVSPERYLFNHQPKIEAGRNEAEDALVFGGAPDYCEANAHFVEDGRFFTDSDLAHGSQVAVVGPDIATALWPLSDPVGQPMTVDGRTFQVIGVFEDQGKSFFGDANGYVAIPITTFDDLYPQVKNGGGDTIHIATVPRRPEDFDALIEEETTILRARRGLKASEENDFALMTSAGRLREVQQITGAVAAAMLVIAGIALLVGGVGVMNIMLVNVTQRTREIGLRKALGARRRDIAVQFLVEAVTLTGVGGALGIGLGLGVALVARLLSPLPAAAPPWAVALGFGVSTTVGLVFGLWPAMKAARQDPIEALRHE